jgi:hypothetical protein
MKSKQTLKIGDRVIHNRVIYESTPKKEVKKWKYSREEIIEKMHTVFDAEFPQWVTNFSRQYILAKSTPKKKSKQQNNPLNKQYIGAGGATWGKQEDKKWCNCKMCKSKSWYKSPSLLNDIETIEEIKRPIAEYKEKCLGRTISINGKINQLIKNQRILTEILKEVMEGGK